MDNVQIFRSVYLPPSVDTEEFLIKTRYVTRVIERALECNLLMGRGEDVDDPEVRAIRLYGPFEDMQFIRGFIAGIHSDRW